MSNYPAVKAFFAHAGPPPWTCRECLVDIWSWEDEDVVVHHEDEDRTNNDPSNLFLLHRDCHQRHHRTGKPLSPETRQRISAATTGTPKSYDDEVREAISQERQQRRYPSRKTPSPFTAEHKTAMSEAQKRRFATMSEEEKARRAEAGRQAALKRWGKK